MDTISNKLLTVKFSWNLRKNVSENLPTNEAATSKKAKSRKAVYVQRLKLKDPTKSEAQRKRDRERWHRRKELAKDRTEKDSEKKRAKWARQKRAQRMKEKSVKSVNKQDESVKKTKVREMSESARKEYWRTKQQESRRKQTGQKKVMVKKNQALAKARKKAEEQDNADGNHQSCLSTSGSTLRRRVREIQKIIPQSPTTYAAVVDRLTASTTPTQRAALNKKGIKRKLSESFVEEGIIDLMKDLKQAKGSKTTEKRRLGHTVLKVCARGKTPYKQVEAYGFSAKTYNKARKGRLMMIRKMRKDAIQPHVAAKIEEYWYEISREVPLKRRVKKGKPLFLLECTYTAAYRDFKKSHPSINVGYVKFIELKPKNVRHLKALERIVCCCRPCENKKLILKALNNVIKKDASLSSLRVMTEKDLSDITLCPYDPVGFPEMKCLERKCGDCGVKQISEHYTPLCEKHGTDEVVYEEWRIIKETRAVRDGKGGKVVKQVTSLKCTSQTATVTEIVKLVEDSLPSFSAHLHRARWQQHQFKLLKEHMPPKSSVVVIDFAENYACGMQNEVQVMAVDFRFTHFTSI